jgi:hypothetical protein
VTQARLDAVVSLVMNTLPIASPLSRYPVLTTLSAITPGKRQALSGEDLAE